MQNLSLVEQSQALWVPIGFIAKKTGYTYTYIYNIFKGRVKMPKKVEAVLQAEIEERKAKLRKFLQEN